MPYHLHLKCSQEKYFCDYENLLKNTLRYTCNVKIFVICCLTIVRFRIGETLVLWVVRLYMYDIASNFCGPKLWRFIIRVNKF